ncbi:MAG TPA: TrbC/VirB2 family protein [Candidatus Omnitrophota bacterium]|nr:TrbC/VirB2 family protein [Candidatus Omnitrophota bacterium]
MNGKSIGPKIQKLALFGLFLLIQAQVAYAEATSESDLGAFLEGVGDFLIRTVGPAVLVIGVGVAGVGMALGDERAMQRGALAAGGGALILLSRAILDFITHIAHF